MQAVKDVRNHFNDPNAEAEIETMVSNVMKNIGAYVESACGDMDAALSQDIKATEDAIQQMIKESKLDQDQKQAQIKTRNSAIGKLKEIMQKAGEICEKYNIEDAGVK